MLGPNSRQPGFEGVIRCDELGPVAGRAGEVLFVQYRLSIDLHGAAYPLDCGIDAVPLDEEIDAPLLDG